MSHKKQFQPYTFFGRYYNYADEKFESMLLPSFIMLFECYWNAVKQGVADGTPWYTPEPPVSSSDQLCITWIGHSTFLVQVCGINILTDPVFGHLPFFKRQIRPGIPLEKIPKLDYVIISHNHRDHMDSHSLTYLKEHHGCTFLVPKGDKEWFSQRGFSSVKEYTWWEQETFMNGSTETKITFLPALHWSQRGLTDFNRSLWGSWMIQCKGETIYFAGDTAYAGHFSAIAKEFPHIGHALMPIGPCEPRKWMKKSHMNAEEAVQAFLDLQAHKFFPMHWGTFSFGTDPYTGPYERLVVSWHQQKMRIANELIVLTAGQRFQEPALKITFPMQADRQTEIER